MSRPYDRSYVYGNFGKPVVGYWRFFHQPYRSASDVYDNFGKPVGNRQLHNQPDRSDQDEFQRRKIKSDIESGWVDPNSVNENGGPLWHCICQKLKDDDVDSVRSLFSPSREGYQPVQIDAQDNFGRTALHLAVYNKLERITEFLLSRGANPNLANDKGETPLHVICRIAKNRTNGTFYRNVFNCVYTLEAYNQRRQFAEEEKHIIESLLARGADPNAADANGCTPLHVVCWKKVRRSRSMNDYAYRNYQSVIESMLRHGADPNLANAEGSTPLHLICKAYDDNYRLAETLFELCDQRYRPFLRVDARDAMGETPLHLALRESNEQLIQWLLLRGANRTLTNSKGETPLHVACQRYSESVDLARWIMAIRSDDDDRHPRVQIDARDNSNNAPLHFAASQGHSYLVDFLLEEGANPTLVNDKGETPLHLVCLKACFDNYAWSMPIIRPNPLPANLDTYHNYQSKIESMLRRGADPTLANAEGSTPLHLICQGNRDDRQSAEMLFELGDERYRPSLRVDARDGNGETALHLATNKGHNELVDFLLRRGADQNAVNDNGETPLHNICRRGDVKMLQKFFDVNQEVNKEMAVDAVDRLGRTPLQWAVANFKLDMIDLLFDRGADLSSFVFPVERHFYDRCKTNPMYEFNVDDIGEYWFKMELASGIMVVVEHLQSKGYELKLSDALTIMNFFANHGLFEKSPEIVKSLTEYHLMYMKPEMIKPNLSLYDLIQLRPKEAAKQLTYKDYFELVCSRGFGWTFGDFRGACFAHLCEKLSSKFFRSYALQPFQKLIHYRLPLEICEIIIETLTNKDLYHVCLAAEGQTVKDGKICAIKRKNKRSVRARKAPKRLKIEW